MNSKPILEIKCVTCSHCKKEFSAGCNKGRREDEREHGFCPCWAPSKNAIHIAFTQFAWEHGLDRFKIHDITAKDWHCKNIPKY